MERYVPGFWLRFSAFLLLVFGSAITPVVFTTLLGYESLTGYAWFDARSFQTIFVLMGFLALFSHEIIEKLWSSLGGTNTAKFEIFVSLCILITIFMVPELGLRGYGFVQEGEPFFKEFYTPVDPEEDQGLYRQHFYLGAIPSNNFEGKGELEGIRTNSYGFRDDALRNGSKVYTIMALGGSTTWGTGVSNTSMTYPAQLERMLNKIHEKREFEVINAGLPGYTTAESLINLQYRGIQHDIDAIILYNAYNDLKTNHVEGCSNGDYSCWRQNPGDKSGKPLWYYSRFLNSIVKSTSNSEGVRHDNITKKGIDSYKRNLRGIIAISEENDIEVIFSTMDHTVTPKNVKEYPEELDSVRKYVPKLSYEGIRIGMEEYNNAMTKVAEERGVLIVDNAEKIPSNYNYHTDHVHFTDKGSRALAKNFIPAVNKTIEN